MQKRILWYLGAGLGAGLIGGLAWGMFYPKISSAPTVNSTTNQTTNTNQSTPSNVNPDTTTGGTTQFSTLDLPDRDPAFDFSANIPTAWAVEYVADSQAINVYDPRGTGQTSLANSRIFIKYFSAATFTTLTTVDILSRTETTIAGRPAVTYRIKKKAAAANFPSQPSWRNGEHMVTDIRRTDDNPATFYVFAQAPDVTDTTFESFLKSLNFTASQAGAIFSWLDFLNRMTTT